MWRDLERQLIRIAIAAVILVPLGVWKLVEIVIWVWHRFDAGH